MAELTTEDPGIVTAEDWYDAYLCKDRGHVTVDDLACLVQLGWAEPVGHTEDGTVTSYALTPAGRAVLQNQRYRDHRLVAELCAT